ncbi:MAG: Unknown protein [uncultured Aureispira sp.]|uniref:Uncharacterized protein n=1 Tax=uncultured Aureispira sp. TaxID=1331704 RepID=A0A6S6UL10_9BACT|nr:MAG: Unknown protein [uncultured Aureispira sp.]
MFFIEPELSVATFRINKGARPRSSSAANNKRSAHERSELINGVLNNTTLILKLLQKP